MMVELSHPDPCISEPAETSQPSGPVSGAQSAPAAQPAPPVKGARLGRYFALSVALNLALTAYALLAATLFVRYVQAALAAGRQELILTILWTVVIVSPILLSILLNRLLYARMRRGLRFPRRTAFFAFLAAVAVQAVAMCIALQFYSTGAEALFTPELLDGLHSRVAP